MRTNTPGGNVEALTRNGECPVYGAPVQQAGQEPALVHIGTWHGKDFATEPGIKLREALNLTDAYLLGWAANIIGNVVAVAFSTTSSVPGEFQVTSVNLENLTVQGTVNTNPCDITPYHRDFGIQLAFTPTGVVITHAQTGDVLVVWATHTRPYLDFPETRPAGKKLEEQVQA